MAASRQCTKSFAHFEDEAVLRIAEVVSYEASDRGRAIDRLLKSLLEWFEQET